MAEAFYTRIGTDDSGNLTNILHKATYDDGSLKIYRNLADSADAGILHVIQNTSPFHRDSAVGPADSNGIIPLDIVEYNRAWDSAGEALAWAKRGR